MYYLKSCLAYSHIIAFPKCKDNVIWAIDKATEILSVMTVSRHDFHHGVMAYMLPFGESAMYRIFVARVVYMEAVFSHLKLKLDDTFLVHNMPEVLIKTECGLTDIG